MSYNLRILDLGSWVVLGLGFRGLVLRGLGFKGSGLESRP